MTDELLRSSALPTIGEIAGRSTDPNFFSALSILPNPDVVLRRAGRSEEVFDAIQSDAHVIGELRSIKASFERYDHQLVPGGDRRVDKQAFELCMSVLNQAPAQFTAWKDILWSIASHVFRGMSVVEIVWKSDGGTWLPSAFLDRPKRRFAFGSAGDLRVLSRQEPFTGTAIDERQFIVARHMPSYDNPYGVALFSSCFWPYVFKHAGYKWFVKFCERFGIPFPVGKYPVGANDEAKRALVSALESLIEAGYAALEDGSEIDIREARGNSAGGKLAQHQLIEACNAEMSKALTSQTLATEQTGGGGSRAASDTALRRAEGINEGDREKTAESLNHLWRLITQFNVPGAQPPRSTFVADEDVSLDRANIYKAFVDIGGRPSRKAAAMELSIELEDPNDPDDRLEPSAVVPSAQLGAQSAAQFARTAASRAVPVDQSAIDSMTVSAQFQPAAEQLVEPIVAGLRDGLDPEALRAKLALLYSDLDDSTLQSLIGRAIFIAMVWGRINAQQSPDA